MGSSAIPLQSEIDQLRIWSGGLSACFSYPEDTIPRVDQFAIIPSTAAEFPESISLVALQTEFTRLFINDLPEVSCPPFGSIYLEGTCMGTTTVEISQLYRSFGWNALEMPDTIAVELECMQMLLSLDIQEPEVITAVNTMVTHLALWTPEFFKRVIENDRCGFFRASSLVGIPLILMMGNTFLPAEQAG